MGDWYKDKKRVGAYLATYKNEKDMNKEVEQAARSGWVADDVAATAGHINPVRTLAKGLLFPSRGKGTWTVKYTRQLQRAP